MRLADRSTRESHATARHRGMHAGTRRTAHADAMSAGPHPELEDAHGWSSSAAALLAELGFTLINGDDPTSPGGANLLVALRDEPTERHFDPEEISYWRFDGDVGRIAALDRGTRAEREGSFSWGRIRLVDRLHVENDFLGFGGTLRVADPDPRTRLVQFHAPAPIFRWAGHSQGLDWLTDEVGAFFARLMIPIDYEGGAEQLVGQVGPAALYAAFVQDAWRRFAATRLEQEAEPELARWARREGHRLEHDDPASVEAGRQLRIRLGLRPAT
jgi:hypothetical protein